MRSWLLLASEWSIVRHNNAHLLLNKLVWIVVHELLKTYRISRRLVYNSKRNSLSLLSLPSHIYLITFVLLIRIYFWKWTNFRINLVCLPLDLVDDQSELKIISLVIVFVFLFWFFAERCKNEGKIFVLFVELLSSSRTRTIFPSEWKSQKVFLALRHNARSTSLDLRRRMRMLIRACWVKSRA